MTRPSIDITIPVLNEEPSLRTQVTQLYEWLQANFHKGGPWRIIIADNGSTDATPQIAEELSLALPQVEWLQVPRRGVGLALKHSWGQSQADIVGYMDLDLATDLSHFLQAYAALADQDYDLVYASRLHENSAVIGRSFKREVASRGFNFLLRSYLRVGFSDGMCGFKWLRRQHLPALMAGGADNDGWFFSTELLTVAEWQGLNLYELPVKWTDDAASSKVKILPLAKRYLKAMRALKQRKP